MAPLCSGIINDIKGRLPWYFDDWVCGASNKKAASATLFIFFVQIFPAITFAAFLHARTESHLGVIETVFSMAIGGVLFAIFAGQPLVVVGVTGPVALICAMLYDLSVRFGIPFYGWLFWTCAWSGLQHVLLAAVNACDLVRLATAFSGECFGFLISVIYLYEGINEFIKTFEGGLGVSLDAALLGLLLGLGHLFVATSMGRARTWTALPKGLRGVLADYGPSLSILLFTGLRFLPRFAPLDIPSLEVPSSFQPSFSRPWVPMEDIRSTPGWAIGAAILPATVLTILLFFDHNISAALTQRPEYGLKKPSSYNWDFCLLGLSVLLTGFLGLPPNYGLIPQAPLHARSLAKIKEVQKGSLKSEVWVSVCETRVSAVGQALLMFVLLSQPLLKALGSIPKGVLAGLFLQIGLAGLQGNSIADRLHFLVMDDKSRRDVHTPWAPQPAPAAVEALPAGTDVPSPHAQEAPTPGAYLAASGAETLPALETAVEMDTVRPVVPSPGSPVSVATIALFTLLQLAIVALIFGITLTPAGIVFPVLIVLLVPCRLYLLPRLFSARQLQALDPGPQPPPVAKPVGAAGKGVEGTEALASTGHAVTIDGPAATPAPVALGHIELTAVATVGQADGPAAVDAGGYTEDGSKADTPTVATTPVPLLHHGHQHDQ